MGRKQGRDTIVHRGTTTGPPAPRVADDWKARQARANLVRGVEAAYCEATQVLIGLTIIRIEVEAFEGYGAPTLTLTLQDSRGRATRAMVMRDPEGNGPGTLHVQCESSDHLLGGG